MNKKMWEVLGIKATKDENVIKDAYRKKLKDTNPEDMADAFKELRRSYELALQWAKTVEDDEEDEKSDLDIWIRKVDELYCNFSNRLNISKWEDLLSDDICIGLDTADEVCESLLIYLMENYYITQNVYALFDKTFGITQMKESLYNRFPKNFIDYVINKIHDKQIFRYDFFELSDDISYEEYDEYIYKYTEYRCLFGNDSSEVVEKRKKLYDEISKMKVYHPYTIVEKMYYLEEEKKYDCLSEYIEQIDKEEYKNDYYILSALGKAKWLVGKKEEGYADLKKTIEIEPEVVKARIDVMECEDYFEYYEQLKETCDDFEKIHGSASIVDNYLKKASSMILDKYKKEVVEEKKYEKLHVLMDCYFSTEKYQEGLECLEEANIKEKDEVFYYEYSGKLFSDLHEYEKADECFEQELLAIKRLNENDNGLIESNEIIQNSIDRKNRSSYVRLLMSNVYEYRARHETKKRKRNSLYNKAVKQLEKAVANELKEKFKLYYYERMATCLVNMGKNEEAIKVCDILIKEKPDWSYAYIERQKANYNLKNAREVISDGDKIIELKPMYLMSYIYSISVYNIFERYTTSLELIEMAVREGIDDDILKYLKACIIYYTNDGTDETRKQIEILEKLKDNNTLKEEDYDNIISINIEYKLALLYMDISEGKKALKYINAALRKKRNNKKYLREKARILFALGEYKKSNDILLKLEEYYKDDAYIFYEIGRNLEHFSAKDALERYEQCLEIDGHFSLALEKVSDYSKMRYRALHNRDDYLKALACQKVLLEDEKNACNYVGIGLTYTTGGELDLALESFKKAIDAEPDNMYGYYNLGATYSKLCDYDNAIIYLDIAKNKQIEKNTSPQNSIIYSELAKVYMCIGDNDKAIETAKEAYERFDEKFSFVDILSCIYKRTNEYEKIIDICEQFLEDNKENKNYNYRDIMLTNAIAYYRIGDKKKSSKIVEEFANICEKINTTEAAYEMYWRRYVYEEEIGNLDKTKEFCINALTFAQVERGIHINTAVDSIMYYSKTGESDKAKEVYDLLNKSLIEVYGSIEVFLDYKLNRLQNCISLSLAACYMNELELAKKYLEYAKGACMCEHCYESECYHIYVAKGAIEYAQNNLEKALEMYEKSLSIYKDDAESIIEIKRINSILKKQKKDDN